MDFARMEASLLRACSRQTLYPITSLLHNGPGRLPVLLRRSYATAQNERVPTSTLLSSALDQKQRSAQREDYAGPFQLGLIPPTPRDGGNLKKWSELSTAGKVARTTARTTNLAVILFGAGFSAVLIYALTSELFSKNSATVLYGQACEKIKASPKLADSLQKPLVFHNNPPSSIRPRHRNHQVSSQIVPDRYGREHMLLHFYIQGRPPGSSTPPESESESYVHNALHWTEDTVSHLSEMTSEEMIETLKARAEAGLDAAKQLFKFLSGDPMPRSSSPSIEQEVREQGKEEKLGWTSGFTGLFSGLRGAPRSASESQRESSDGRVYSEGEVHADLVMNDKGYFEFRYLFVDIPNSHSWNSKRVFVERSDGVRENEPTMTWHS